jgi:hypothetical protein
MQLPEIKKNKFGELRSDKLLVVYSGSWLIARLEQENSVESPCWYTDCSGHYKLNSSKISHWEPLPSIPSLYN